ncbi:MAG: ParB/RepB/Spo0J family partition protein [Burkholderiales bacterium]|nr:ParB/RepB/Spo0J family partition protein [Burkholderiales bacterium]
MGKKLLEKAGLVGAPKALAQVQPDPGSIQASRGLDRPTPLGEAIRPKTAPGTMLGFMTAQSSAIQEAEQLRARLAEFDGATPARKLDPRSVRVSKWANRHAASFEDAEFAALKAEIASAGGNVQAIKVRPVALQGGGAAEQEAGTRYEVVYGHRRHRACLELELPVLAVIEDVSDQQLFVDMERENRDRKDLSAWEQGSMYARALDAGLYPSNRKLAEAIGRDLGDVGKALALARLPAEVVAAFKSPLDLQYRWAKPLADAQQQDPEGLIARARALKGEVGALSARTVFSTLIGAVGQGVGPSNPLAEILVKRAKKVVAVVSTDDKGRTVVRFETALDADRRRALARHIESFLDT